jgi:hypothetical protein
MSRGPWRRLPPKPIALGQARIEILDDDIEEPLWRDALIHTSGVADTRNVRSVGRGHPVIGVVSHLNWRGRPADNGYVKVPQTIGINDGQVVPGNRTSHRRSVFAHRSEFLFRQ